MNKSTEGALYKIIELHGVKFEIKYGYYNEEEKKRWDPTPIFPDFTESPVYTPDGFPFITASQDTCLHYSPKENASGENWCYDCIHFSAGEEIIGTCKNPKKQITERKNE